MPKGPMLSKQKFIIRRRIVSVRYLIRDETVNYKISECIKYTQNLFEVSLTGWRRWSLGNVQENKKNPYY